MRILPLMALVLALLPAAARAADEDVCASDASEPQTRIAACAALLRAPDLTETQRAFALGNRGFGYFDYGDLDRARVDLEVAAKLAPNTPAILVGLGLVARARGDLVGALNFFNEAIGLDARFALAYVSRGDALDQMGDQASALADYNKAIAVDVGNAAAYIGRGGLRLRAGDNKQALEDFGLAIQSEPRNAEAYFRHGTAYEALGDTSSAIADYNSAIQVDPTYVDAYSRRGALWLAYGDGKIAIDDLSKAIQFAPQQPAGYRNRAAAYTKLGNYDAAAADLETAIAKGGTAYIKSWQEYLATRQLYSGPADGVINDAVKAAVSACARDPSC